MSEVLRPCPFCGADQNTPASETRYPNSLTPVVSLCGSHDISVTCWRCEFDGPSSASPEIAARLWNQRPEVDAVVEQIARYVADVDTDAHGTDSSLLSHMLVHVARDIRAGRWKGGK